VFEALGSGLALLFTLEGTIYLCLGVFVGLVFGAVPGLGGTTAIALLMPLTFGMEPWLAITMIGGVMGATSFGGSVSAILLNTPGIAPNAATCFDGYPMAQQGKAGMAIGAAAAASSTGGLIGIFTLVAIIPLAKQIVLSFGPPEFFMLALLGLSAIAVSTGGAFLRGLISALFGLMLALVGYDAVNGGYRFTADVEYLYDGIPLVPTLVGLFALSEMINLTVKGGTVASKESTGAITGVLPGILAVYRHWPILLRGSAIGTFVGALPGVGGTVASFLAYTATVQTAKDRDTFGKGNIKGVIAPESANNAKDGGSLIPTLSFGIPGSAESAIFLGVLILHGIEPGPMLLIEEEAVVVSIILALTASTILASLFGLMVTRQLSMITLVDVNILVPSVVSVALVGVYALKGEFGDVILAMVFGVIGYLMIRFGFPRIALVIALVLGELAERSYHQSLAMADDDWTVFFTREISLILFIVTVLCLLLPALRYLFGRRKKADETP
jgi:putative tricarboxylic transport membrane protein